MFSVLKSDFASVFERSPIIVQMTQGQAALKKYPNVRPLVSRICCVAALIICTFVAASAQNKYDKLPIGDVVIAFGVNETNVELADQFRLTAREALGATYSVTRVRDAIEAVYKTKRVDTVVVSASLNAAGGVDLRFTIKLKQQAERVSVEVEPSVGDKVTEQDLLFKLNLLVPGTAITEQTLRDNASQILEYLRDRGFYRSQVTYSTRPMQSENEVGVTFHVKPNEQAKVESFKITIEGYGKPIPLESLKLEPGHFYSRDRLLSDIASIRAILRKDKFLAPQLDEPRVVYDSDANTIAIDLAGKAGPVVEVSVEAERSKVSSRTQNTLLPVKREGTLDFAAIVEGERRLENYYQEKGYFFVNVTPHCSAEPPLRDDENNLLPNDTEFLCSYLGGEDLLGHKVNVKYVVDLGRRLNLVEIRLRGTDKLKIEDVQSILRSQEASALGAIPFLGYGHGYTSNAILEEDRLTIQSIMAELGYRSADVNVSQGVAPNGDDLIVTFIVDEGPPTIISATSVTGNKAFTTSELAAQLPDLTGLNYSRARVRNAALKLSEFYSNRGYYDARVTTSITEPVDAGETKEVKVEFKIENEGKKVVVNRVLINGAENTEVSAIRKALTVKPGEMLKAADVYTSEQNLYASDAFSRVEVKPRPAGDGPDNTRLSDVIVNVEEQPPRLATYGGGASTDLGLNGFFDIRHFNLFGNLWQGGARVRVSQRQQLVQFDFINPRFIRDGVRHFAPLTVSLGYQRDTTVTRFFRSAFDRGTFGIVQRLDPEGNPIDEFGRETGSPTLNRATLTAESFRTLSRKNRGILFFRYRFEDVRLYNIESLLIKELLRPDQRVRISGFGATVAFDRRRNCSIKYSLLDLIAKGDQVDPCRYNASDPTGGDYLTAEYNVSLPFLGANVGFQKFQASYNYYYSFPRLRYLTLAARGIIGMASVFSGGNRFNNAQFPSLNGILPISERFFAGGANTLRGFDFEEAGPRVVIVPTGTFRNSRGEQVFLDPFTVPFGGNALAAVNLEARIPFSRSLRVVPFYDGGNVFRRVGDIFKPPTVPPGDVELQNQRAVWTHTIGLGFRLKTPVGGEFGVDYARLLNPPRFLIPQAMGFPNAIFRLHADQIHFRFSQAF
jgi:outer membrane protein insertion porin family